MVKVSTKKKKMVKDVNRKIRITVWTFPFTIIRITDNRVIYTYNI